MTAHATVPSAPARARADQLCVDTIRALTMDAIEAAGSGHPGMPLAMAPAAYLLYARRMRHDPRRPDWPDRDRFVLSAGHGSMLLYAALHLSGYDLPLDEIVRFRQWGSRTPGHPERGPAHPGVEVTTGPLGQGFANGVGMAIAERFLRERFGPDLIDHRVYAIVSDGDLMEGVASEAASLAGHLRLGRLVYLYDDNGITLDGPSELSVARGEVPARFRAYGWHVLAVDDANDLDSLDAAIRAGIAERERPTLVCVKSVIGWPSPGRQGSHTAHGAPFGEQEVRATKRAMGWDPDARFHVPAGVREAFRAAAEQGRDARRAWQSRLDALDGTSRAEWDRAWAGAPEPGLADVLPPRWSSTTLALRDAGREVMTAFAPHVPTMLGGAADVVESTKAELPDPRRNVHFGVREHAMGAAVNGMAAHGGIVRPFGATFLQFADYMRPAIRLSALMSLPVTWIFTHDSITVGEDGPTHQPVEHLAALRAIPGLTLLRPADAHETAEAWRMTLEELTGPVALVLSRLPVPPLDADRARAGVRRGAYVVQDGDGPVLVGTGAEVHIALEAACRVGGARVVSMPSWELFAEQDAAYRHAVLPPDRLKVSVEAGISMGWERWVDASVAVERFGASAPPAELLEHLGITPEAVVAAAAR